MIVKPKFLAAEVYCEGTKWETAMCMCTELRCLISKSISFIREERYVSPLTGFINTRKPADPTPIHCFSERVLHTRHPGRVQTRTALVFVPGSTDYAMRRSFCMFPLCAYLQFHYANTYELCSLPSN
ncbi:hypothetical protein RRG08_029643 [Elysia crispata]|uniref:Uncharacterized protein n=1 Tax=Elysia crispata TaxID=231223 RepID=A0AAE0XP98_9GAST|nr:hypothetical protein RRG08_029643 [Elysia crispata]